MFKKICFILPFIVFSLASGLFSVNLKKIASFDSVKILDKMTDSSRDMNNLYFDNGKRILVGRDFGYPENYRFYLIKNPVMNNTVLKTPIEIKEFEEISFSFNQFCSLAKKENNYNCEKDKPKGGMYIGPELWYLNSEQGFAILVLSINSKDGYHRYLAKLDLKSKEITEIKKIQVDPNFGLAYTNEGDFQKDAIQWFSDLDGRLFRINFPEMEFTENVACSEKLKKIKLDQTTKREAEQKRTGESLVRLPNLRTTPFISADEKFVLMFDYSDIEDGHNNNPIGLAYYCELETGKMETFPGQHTVYATTMTVPGKIIYYANQRGEYYILDMASKKLTKEVKSKTSGDRIVIFEDSAIVYEDDYAWVEARKLSDIKKVKSYSMYSMEKIKNNYTSKITINPQTSTFLFANYEGNFESPIKMKLFIYKMSSK